MTILAIGGTGQVGSQVVAKLAAEGADVVVMTQRPDSAKVPDGVRTVKGDGLEPEATRAALAGVDTLFYLSPVTSDELTRTLLTLRLAADAKLKGIVYFSMVNCDRLVDVPHAAAKYAGERLIETLDLPATILRPNYFFQNGVVKELLLDKGVYAMPLGRKGGAIVDIGDIAEVAAIELLRRERADAPLPRDLVDVSGPEVLTGDDIAAIWSEVLGRTVAYAGDDLVAFEAQTRAYVPPEMAYDVALMFDAWQKIGVLPMPGAADRLTKMLGRPLKTYREFARETAAQWRAG